MIGSIVIMNTYIYIYIYTYIHNTYSRILRAFVRPLEANNNKN